MRPAEYLLYVHIGPEERVAPQPQITGLRIYLDIVYACIHVMFLMMRKFNKIQS